MASEKQTQKRQPKWLLFFLIAALIAVALSTTIAFAYGGTGESQSHQTVQPAATASVNLKYAVAPEWQPLAGAVGGVDRPGDLYYIDLRGNRANAVVTLLLTNPDKLIRNYSYLNLNIGIYVKGQNGGWERATSADGQTIGDTYLTLINGQVSFVVAGGSEYVVTIDGGAYYATGTEAPGGSLSPEFYLTVN